MLVGLYVYADYCKWSLEYLPIWENFANTIKNTPVDIVCAAIEISYNYKDTPIVDVINSFNDIKIVDTKPCILFFDVDLKVLYLSATRPVTVEKLTTITRCILDIKSAPDGKIDYANCSFHPASIIDNDNRREIISGLEPGLNLIYYTKDEDDD